MTAAQPLGGKVALVTGGARGIGLGFAFRLAELGARLVVADRALAPDPDAVEPRLAGKDLEAALRGTGADVLVAEVDVTDADAVSRLVDQTNHELGPIEIAVCNAGGAGGYRALASELGRDELLNTYELNVLSAVNVVRAVTPQMKRLRRGKLITVSSLAGVSAYNDGWLAGYAIAKAALVQYTRYLAQELGPHGITANVLAPGPTETVRFRAKSSQSHLDELAAATALRRLATVDDNANVLEFLCTDLSDYITGQVLTVEGGRIRGPR
jgi:3-oxoacyl-[acyl-carrier protein] reductase